MAGILSALFLSAALSLVPHMGFAAVWKVDHSRSKIGIIVSVNGSPAEGRLENFNAAIDFDPARPQAARIKVEIDLTTVKMKDPLQTAALSGKNWFNTARFPYATFTSTNVKSTGTGTFVISANLTLKGTTIPVTLPFTLTTSNKKAHATGELIIMRNNFNVGEGQFSSGAIAGLDVRVIVDIIAEQTD